MTKIVECECNYCGELVHKDRLNGQEIPVNQDGTPHITTCAGIPENGKIPSDRSNQQIDQFPIADELATKQEKVNEIILTASKMSGIDPHFIMLFHGKPYVLRTGLLNKADKKGYRAIEVKIEEKIDNKGKGETEYIGYATLWPKLTEDDYNVLKSLPDNPDVTKIIVEALIKPFTDIGTASKGNVNNPSMHKYLRELASTRASNRVLRAFTACGFTSVEELPDAELNKGEIGGS